MVGDSLQLASREPRPAQHAQADAVGTGGTGTPPRKLPVPAQSPYRVRLPRTRSVATGHAVTITAGDHVCVELGLRGRNLVEAGAAQIHRRHYRTSSSRRRHARVWPIRPECRGTGRAGSTGRGSRDTSRPRPHGWRAPAPPYPGSSVHCGHSSHLQLWWMGHAEACPCLPRVPSGARHRSLASGTATGPWMTDAGDAPVGEQPTDRARRSVPSTPCPSASTS